MGGHAPRRPRPHDHGVVGASEVDVLRGRRGRAKEHGATLGAASLSHGSVNVSALLPYQTTAVAGYPPASAMPRLARKPVLLFALFVAVSLLTRWLSLVVEVLDVDEAAYVVGSWELLRGRLLYADFVDNKPPLLYVYYALAQAAFGRGLIAVHLATALVTVPATALAASASSGTTAGA